MNTNDLAINDKNQDSYLKREQVDKWQGVDHWGNFCNG